MDNGFERNCALKEILEITNKKYVEILESIASKIEAANIETTEKNLVLMATGRMIKIYKNYFIDSPIESVENARSIYEMIMKAIAINDDLDIKESYEKIDKEFNEQNDKPGQIRKRIQQHFNEYFSLIEDDEIIKTEFPKGVLDYLYSCLSRYTHPTKEKEFIFELLKNNKYADFALISIYMEYIESVMIIFMDLVSTKYKTLEEEVQNFISIFALKILTFIYLYLPININTIVEIAKFANTFFESNKNNEEYFKKLETVSQMQGDILNTMFSDSNAKALMVNKLVESLEKIFSDEEKLIIDKEYTRLGEEIKETIDEYRKLVEEYTA